MSTDLALRQRELFAPIEKAASLPEGSLSFVGLTLTDVDLPYDEWEEIGRKLGHVHRWSAFALGDWLNFGTAVYGEEAFNATEGTIGDRYDLATRVTGLAYRTLVNYASICGRIAVSRRRVELPFSTHEPVAALPPDEQAVWLQRAVDHSWTKHELRSAVENGYDPNPEPTPPPARVLDPPQTPHDRLAEVARRVFHQGQVRGSTVEVPIEPWRQLAEALGEE